MRLIGIKALVAVRGWTRLAAHVGAVSPETPAPRHRPPHDRLVVPAVMSLAVPSMACGVALASAWAERAPGHRRDPGHRYAVTALGTLVDPDALAAAAGFADLDAGGPQAAFARVAFQPSLPAVHGWELLDIAYLGPDGFLSADGCREEWH